MRWRSGFRDELRALIAAHRDDGDLVLMEALVVEIRRLGERVRQGADFPRTEGSDGDATEAG